MNSVDDRPTTLEVNAISLAPAVSMKITQGKRKEAWV